jgi:class 3 adenylate cyclase
VRFEELAASAAAPAAVAAIRALVAEGTDFDCYKVNAFRIAEALGVPRAEGLRAFLFASRLGLFDLNWDIHCPSCMAVPEYHHHLVRLTTRAHCGLCALAWEIDFEDHIEVTFTVNPDVRRLAVVDFADRDYLGKIASVGELRGRERRPPVFADKMTPGATRTERFEVASGDHDYQVPGPGRASGTLRVHGERSSGPQAIRIEIDRAGQVEPRELEARPGPIELTIVNGMAQMEGFRLIRKEPLRNWVSAAHVTAQQDFRDLFSGEFLGPDSSFSVRSTTLMFTDIRGSTEMYERLGDAAALAVVRAHFHVMTEVIRAHEGGIVKTIGDAVMASFPVNLEAIRAACEIQLRFARLSGTLAGVEVKIGLHRGPAIAVGQNRNLDFFGRTVNVAARVQDKARPRAVLATDEVLSDRSVADYLAGAGHRTERFEVQLKGVDRPVAVTSIDVTATT